MSSFLICLIPYDNISDLNHPSRVSLLFQKSHHANLELLKNVCVPNRSVIFRQTWEIPTPQSSSVFCFEN